MPKPDPESPDRLPPETEAALRAALLGRGELLPLTPAEVGVHDDRKSESPAVIPPPPPTGFSWEKEKPAAKAADVVSFPDQAALDALAFAARSGSAISAETRAKVAQLVGEMRGPTPPSDDRR